MDLQIQEHLEHKSGQNIPMKIHTKISHNCFHQHAAKSYHKT